MKTKIFKFNFRKKSRGAALLISTFISIIAALLVITMMDVSVSNTNQIVNDQDGKIAYYAAEGGFAKVNSYFNASFLNWGNSIAEAALPTQDSPETLSNGASFWVSSITYSGDNTSAIIDVVGDYKDSQRKIRTQFNTTIPSYFDDYGLLTNGRITINGKKTLDMSIHGNDGLTLNGKTTLGEDAVATQSTNPAAGDPETTPLGGYIPAIDVPQIPIDDLRTLAQTGLNITSTEPDLNTQINNAPAGSLIYISGDIINNGGNSLTFSGDMQGKIIFVDGNITINASNGSPLSNVVVISSGSLTVNGNIDIGTSHPGKVDTVFACQNSITLNGSRNFQSLFWTNGAFTQNGSSMSGRVVTQNGITFNGTFTLNYSNKLYDFGIFDKVITIQSWRQVSMD